MVFRISKWNAPSIAQWRPAQWWSLSARCHRAQEVWRYQNAIAARRDYTKLAQSLRNDRLYFEVDHGSFFTMTPVLQIVCVVRLHLHENSIRIVAETASPIPAFIPFALVLGLVCFWLPFPDLGVNHKIIASLRARCLLVPTTKRPPQITLIEAGAPCAWFGIIIDYISPQSLFFFIFILVPVFAALAFLVFFCEITRPPSRSL